MKQSFNIFVPVCVYQVIYFVVLDHIMFLVTHVNLQEGQLTLNSYKL